MHRTLNSFNTQLLLMKEEKLRIRLKAEVRKLKKIEDKKQSQLGMQNNDSLMELTDKFMNELENVK